MIYSVTHKTTYKYEYPCSLCYNEARLIPKEFRYQSRNKYQIKITPEPASYHERHDFFGNVVSYFSIEQPHERLDVVITTEVDLLERTENSKTLSESMAWEKVNDWLRTDLSIMEEVAQYRLDSPMVQINQEIEAYARASFRPGIPILEASYHLMQRIYIDFKFNPGFTTISTPITDVLRYKKGVCQDFAHLAIGCLRSVGLPARYVSGYIETIPPPGKVKLVGSDASHAWFSVFSPGIGWVDFDPTNNQMPGFQHITTAWGRDYADVAPLKGVIFSNGKHDLSVSVDVKRITK